MTERQSWGVPVDRDSLLAGVIDSVSGRLQLPADELNTLTAQADAAAMAAREKRVNEQQRHDEDYLAQFSQQKGVKQSAMGFWYRVDYAGEGALAPTAVVDVVVKEKLTDGTVIQDMELSGKVLSQPLSVSAAVQGGDKPSAQPRFADDGRAAGAGVRRNRLPAESAT